MHPDLLPAKIIVEQSYAICPRQRNQLSVLGVSPRMASPQEQDSVKINKEEEEDVDHTGGDEKEVDHTEVSLAPNSHAYGKHSLQNKWIMW